MKQTVTAYPLCWPECWPKTELAKRERGAFRCALPAALNNLRREVSRLGGRNLVLSSNYTLGVGRPSDPGVVAYFEWKGNHLAVPCDRWALLEHNVQAIALTLAAMRGMERWGAKHMIRAMFTGFKALPAGDHTPWWNVLGISQHSALPEVKEAYRALAKQHHPDAGGDANRFLRIQAAYDQAVKDRDV